MPLAQGELPLTCPRFGVLLAEPVPDASKPLVEAGPAGFLGNHCLLAIVLSVVLRNKSESSSVARKKMYLSVVGGMNQPLMRMT